MAKTKSVYICQSCGSSSVKWRGKCPNCGTWNSYQEEIVSTGKKQASPSASAGDGKTQPETLGEFTVKKTQRIPTPDEELNRVLGGGIVPGSLILLGGEPGIGKSTLMLHLALEMRDQTILYVSGEESLNQVKIRASRIGAPNSNCYLLPETSFELIAAHLEKIQPGLLIIDSIQTMQSAAVEATAGSIIQIRESASGLQKIAKKTGIPVFLIGHITKEGYIAGPKVLEHMVDTVLYFEGDRHYNHRILRTIKNRFGSVAEIGIYEMLQNGLRPVKNPSELLLSKRDHSLSGVSIAATMEGLRPMMIEIQGLVSPTYYGTPQRTPTGIDNRRFSMLIAVLEKRCQLQMNMQDIFLNIAGGLKVEDPSIDLAICAALASSYNDQPIGNELAFAGEVGLSGEIRAVQLIDQRIAEAEKLGFGKIFISSLSPEISYKPQKLEVKKVDTLMTLLKKLF